MGSSPRLVFGGVVLNATTQVPDLTSELWQCQLDAAATACSWEEVIRPASLPVCGNGSAAPAGMAIARGSSAERALADDAPCWPAPRGWHTAVHIGANESSRMAVFGGRKLLGLHPRETNELLFFDFDQKGQPGWEAVVVAGRAPAPRYGHSADTLGSQHRMVIFGGFNSSDVLSDVRCSSRLRSAFCGHAAFCGGGRAGGPRAGGRVERAVDRRVTRCVVPCVSCGLRWLAGLDLRSQLWGVAGD